MSYLNNTPTLIENISSCHTALYNGLLDCMELRGDCCKLIERAHLAYGQYITGWITDSELRDALRKLSIEMVSGC